jgi:serine/threonine protein kinase
MVAREGRMLARLGAGHINIVRPLEIVLTSRHLAFITEYVPGTCAVVCVALPLLLLCRKSWRCGGALGIFVVRTLSTYAGVEREHTTRSSFIHTFVCCAGGSLSDYLVRNKMDEDVARYFFKQLLSALSYW